MSCGGQASSHAHILCGCEGPNLLGIENYLMIRGTLHVVFTTASTGMDRHYQNLVAHGLGSEYSAGLRCVLHAPNSGQIRIRNLPSGGNRATTTVQSQLRAW